MWFSIRRVGTGSIRLMIAGNLDVTTVPDLEPMLARLGARQPSQVEVELSRLRMIDTFGVGALIGFYKRSRLSGGVATLRGLRDQPLTLFRLLRLHGKLGGFDPDHRNAPDLLAAGRGSHHDLKQRVCRSSNDAGTEPRLDGAQAVAGPTRCSHAARWYF
jgi:anti-sigma B factor antagonist